MIFMIFVMKACGRDGRRSGCRVARTVLITIFANRIISRIVGIFIRIVWIMIGPSLVSVHVWNILMRISWCAIRAWIMRLFDPFACDGPSIWIVRFRRGGCCGRSGRGCRCGGGCGGWHRSIRIPAPLLFASTCNNTNTNGSSYTSYFICIVKKEETKLTVNLLNGKSIVFR